MGNTIPRAVKVKCIFTNSPYIKSSEAGSPCPVKGCSKVVPTGTACHKSSVPALVSLPVIFTTSPEDDDEECEEGSLLLKIVSKLGDNEEVISSA